MRKSILTVIVGLLLLAGVQVSAQTAPLLKRTTSKTERIDFGAGGTLTITGAPVGNIRVEGWDKREIEIAAEIEVQAATEAELTAIGDVTGFVLDEGLGRTVITSVALNNRRNTKKVSKRLPKNVSSLPFRIDYVIKVPRYCDLQIAGGKGDLTVAGVDGTHRVNFIDTTARINLIGGSFEGVFGSGRVEIVIPRAGWRGRFVDAQLASGDMLVRLPEGLNADVDATVLRSGKIDNSFSALVPRVKRVAFTDRSIAARAGSGGVQLKFAVGDGTLVLSRP